MKIFNKAAIHLQLSEAKIALDDLIKKVEQGKFDEGDDVLIAIDLEDILSHLCLAWHFRCRNDSELQRLSQETYEVLSYSIPKWHEDLRLLNDLDV
jgi:hypothetical protein